MTVRPTCPYQPPSPAYGPDTVVAGLRTAETILVVSMRLFLAPPREGALASADWQGGFRAVGMDGTGIAAAGSLFGILGATSRRPLDIREPLCPLLGADEGSVLQLVSHLQHRRIEPAVALLAAMLPPAAVRLALPSATGLASAMACGSLIIPLRSACIAALARSMPAHSNPGLALMQ